MQPNITNYFDYNIYYPDHKINYCNNYIIDNRDDYKKNDKVHDYSKYDEIKKFDQFNKKFDQFNKKFDQFNNKHGQPLCRTSTMERNVSNKSTQTVFQPGSHKRKDDSEIDKEAQHAKNVRFEQEKSNSITPQKRKDDSKVEEARINQEKNVKPIKPPKPAKYANNLTVKEMEAIVFQNNDADKLLCELNALIFKGIKLYN